MQEGALEWLTCNKYCWLNIGYPCLATPDLPRLDRQNLPSIRRKQMSELAFQVPQFTSYAIASEEDRCSSREKVHIPAHLRPSGSTGFSVTIKNLSVAGFSAEALTGMKPGSRIFITLPGLVAQQAEIVWNDGMMIGCSFHNLLNTAVYESFVRRYRAKFQGHSR
jgi:PilZ domain